MVEVHPAPGGAIDLTAYGTTTSSTITITQTEPRYHAPSQLLLIRDLRIRSGELGGLSAMTAELEGRMTPLTGPLQTLAFGMIGPKAQVDVNGNVDSLGVSNINLGPTGHVTITGDVNSIAQVGNDRHRDIGNDRHRDIGNDRHRDIRDDDHDRCDQYRRGTLLDRPRPAVVVHDRRRRDHQP